MILIKTSHKSMEEIKLKIPRSIPANNYINVEVKIKRKEFLVLQVLLCAYSEPAVQCTLHLKDSAYLSSIFF